MTPPPDTAQTGSDRIVAAALRLFEERGYASTSLADVAAEAGMLKGNLAYYFATKPALLDAVLRSRQAELEAALGAGQPHDAAPAATIERLLAYVDAQAPVLAASGCPVGSLSTELGKLDAQLHQHAAGLLLGLLGWLQLQFARALPAPAARECAEHLLAVLQGAAVLAQASRDPAVIRRQVSASRAWLAVVLG
ncbi:TetR/AcrR family transcriptional regulator [Roseateles sp. LYH14W]|uniref:TetR/AcrR family transcriptional regulator n=1 Tax=Pelomonas parva TaxID=3299032 RepID=A0ABW7FCK7_9BURK